MGAPLCQSQECGVNSILTYSSDNLHRLDLCLCGYVLFASTLRSSVTFSKTAATIAQVNCDQGCRFVF